MFKPFFAKSVKNVKRSSAKVLLLPVSGLSAGFGMVLFLPVICCFVQGGLGCENRDLSGRTPAGKLCSCGGAAAGSRAFVRPGLQRAAPVRRGGNGCSLHAGVIAAGVSALLYKAASCTAVVALTYGLPGRRSFVQLCLWYVLLNVLLCGAALLPGVHTNNFAVYISLPPGRLLASCAVVYGVLRGLLYCFGRAGVRSVPARLELNGSALPVQAFYDTGFSVQDPLSGRAVVLVQYRPARPLLSAPVQQFLDAYFAAEDAALPPPGAGVRLVPCRTVTGQALLPAVPAALRTATACVPGLLAAFCREPLSPGGGTLLFGPDTARQLGLCEDGLSTYL